MQRFVLLCGIVLVGITIGFAGAWRFLTAGESDAASEQPLVIRQGWTTEPPCTIKPEDVGKCLNGRRSYTGSVNYFFDVRLAPESKEIRVIVVHSAAKAVVGLRDLSGNGIVSVPSPANAGNTELVLTRPFTAKPGPYQIYLYIADTNVAHTISRLEWTIR